MTKNTAEFKTHNDFTPKARYLLTQIISKGLDISLDVEGGDNKLLINFTDKALITLACDLLDVYKEGWDDRSITL